MAIGEARFDDVVKSTLGAFKQRFERFSSRAHRLPLMLAHALSLEADSLPNGGNTGATSVVNLCGGKQKHVARLWTWKHY